MVHSTLGEEDGIICLECGRSICRVSEIGKDLDAGMNADYNYLVCPNCSFKYTFEKKYKFPAGHGNLKVLELSKKGKVQEMRYWVARRLMGTCELITHESGQIYGYADNPGLYVPVEMNLKTEIQRIMGTVASVANTNEVLGHIMRTTYASEKVFDEPPNWINLKNGIYDVAAEEFFDHTPQFISRSQTPVNYDPDAECPKIMKFLHEVLKDEDIPILQEIAGYLLQRDTAYQKAFMFIGDGANGKSTLLSLLESFVGRDNVAAVSLQDLASNRFASCHIVGKLANLYPDLSDKSLYDTGMFKCLVGGDSITVEQKYKAGFQYRNYAKLIFSCNKLPETKDQTGAFFRRWIFITFPNMFTPENRDPYLLEKITTDEELSGFLNFALDGLTRLNEKGGFSDSLTTEEIREYYIRLSSPVGSFVLDELMIDSVAYVVKDDMYQAFVEYCVEHKLASVDKSVFGKLLPEYAPATRSEKKMVGGNRKHCWTGYKLIKLPPYEEPKNDEMVDLTNF